MSIRAESVDKQTIPWWMYLGIAGCLAAIHLLCLLNGFVDFDDDTIFLQNPNFELDWGPFLSWAFDMNRPDTWRPLRDLSHYLDLQIHGQDPVWSHAHNLSLLASTGALTLRLFVSLGIRRSLACVAVLLAFAHPAQVEAITWVSGRKDLLAAPFLVCTLLAFIRFCHGKQSMLWATSVVGLGACGVMAKGHVVVIPVLLMWTYLLIRNRVAQDQMATRTQIGMLLLTLLIGAAALAPRIAAGGVSLLPELEQNAATDILLADKLQLPLRYLGLLLWPFNLNHIYFTPELNAWRIPAALLSVAVVLGLVIQIIRWFKQEDQRGPILAMGCTLMLPYMHFKTGVVYMADRYLFAALPFFVLTIILSIDGHSIWQRMSLQWKRSIVALLLLLMTVAGSATHSAFRDSVSLWTRMTLVYERSDWGYERLGRALYHRGDYEAAAGAWLRAWELRPGTAKHLNNAAVAAMALGRNQMALDLLSRVLTLEPSNAKALSNIRIIRKVTGVPSQDERTRTPRLDQVESKKR